MSLGKTRLRSRSFGRSACPSTYSMHVYPRVHDGQTSSHALSDTHFVGETSWWIAQVDLGRSLRLRSDTGSDVENFTRRADQKGTDML